VLRSERLQSNVSGYGMRRVLQSERLQSNASGYGVRRVLRSFHYVTKDAHHSQTHSQQRNLTQHDMLPQHPVNTMELFCDYF